MGTLPNTLVGLPGRAPGDLSRTCTSSFVLAVLPLPCLDEGEGSVCAMFTTLEVDQYYYGFVCQLGLGPINRLSIDFHTFG